MKQKARDIMKNYYDKLPANIRQILTGPDLQNRLIRISQKNGLRTDKAGIVEDEVALVLLGLEHPNDLILNLKHQLKVGEPELKRLVADIDREIFSPIRTSLLTLHNTSDVKPTEADLAPKPTLVENTTPKSQQKPPERHVESPGIERTMPKDILRAKLSQETHSKAEKKEIDESDRYQGGDPYRESTE